MINLILLKFYYTMIECHMFEMEISSDFAGLIKSFPAELQSKYKVAENPFSLILLVTCQCNISHVSIGLFKNFRNKDLSCTSDEEEENLQDVMNSYNPAAKKYVCYL